MKLALRPYAAMLVFSQLGLALAPANLAAQQVAKDRNSVRITAGQMHQLEIAAVEQFPFVLQKAAIGQIAFNEDTSTIVLSPFSGRVTRLLANVGDRVKRGQPLMEIDSPEVLPPQNDFVTATTNLNKARSQLSLAETVEQRHRMLYENKAGTLREWQQSQAQLSAAQSDLRSAETAVDAGRNRLRIIGRSEEAITALQEKGTISRTIAIEAPIDGTVIARKVGPGQQVRSDSNDPLFTVADLSTMWLKAYVPETDIAFVRIGQDIDVRVSALPEREYKARIVAVGAASDAQTRRIIVRSEIPNPDGMLRAEMFATFRIRGATQTSLAVPMDAVVREGDIAAVWIEQESDKLLFKRQLVTIGIEQDGKIQIRDGLKAGQRVVARGAIFIDNEAR